LLHVEDEDSSARLFRTALDHARIAVSVYRVSDGHEALAFLNRSGIYKMARRPELIVLDLNMPRVDGWTVLSRVCGNDELRTIPVVVLSTSSQPEDQTRALSLGARRYVIKPDDFYGLVQEVESICADFLPLLAWIVREASPVFSESQLIDDGLLDAASMSSKATRNNENPFRRQARDVIVNSSPWRPISSKIGW
jgi:CheY-like chemotaxis protein